MRVTPSKKPMAQGYINRRKLFRTAKMLFCLYDKFNKGLKIEKNLDKIPEKRKAAFLSKMFSVREHKNQIEQEYMEIIKRICSGVMNKMMDYFTGGKTELLARSNLNKPDILTRLHLETFNVITKFKFEDKNGLSNFTNFYNYLETAVISKMRSLIGSEIRQYRRKGSYTKPFSEFETGEIGGKKFDVPDKKNLFELAELKCDFFRIIENNLNEFTKGKQRKIALYLINTKDIRPLLSRKVFVSKFMASAATRIDFLGRAGRFCEGA